MPAAGVPTDWLGHMASGTGSTITSINSEDLRRILGQGRRALEDNVEAINALNVFPVPDGDTGTNMLLTMKAIEDEPPASGGSISPGSVTAMARGALLGARGNSGVIFAQFFQGLARGLEGLDSFGAEDLAKALTEGSAAAYKAVGNPVEGTMLTVIREMAEAAQQEAGRGVDVIELWEAVCQSARLSVAKTPTLLPVLREAGVVDAGGLGLSVIMEGALSGLRDEELGAIELPAPDLEGDASALQSVSDSFIDATEEDLYGYCTQFLIQGEGLDPDDVRTVMESLATSTVVIGGEGVVRVHVHTEDPGPVVSYGVSVGTVSQVSIENMDEQHQEFVAARREEKELQPVGVLAIASGEGLTEVFLGSGAAHVLSGGDTMNPSTKEILQAVEAVGAERVIVLPNNPNIVGAAEQARSLSERQMEIIPTESIPQGIAALLSFNALEDFEENMADMEQAISAVASGAIGNAQRDAELGGVHVAEGQVMGLLERRMIVSGDDRTSVLCDLIERIGPESGSLITLYWGADTREQEAQGAGERLLDRFQGVEVDVVFGGQPHYNYILSVE